MGGKVGKRFLMQWWEDRERVEKSFLLLQCSITFHREKKKSIILLQSNSDDRDMAQFPSYPRFPNNMVTTNFRVLTNFSG